MGAASMFTTGGNINHPVNGLAVQHDLFAYPNAPGWKARDTSREAAKKIAPAALTLRDQVLASIRARAGTPEQVAHRLRVPLMNVRPRCSELAAKGLIRDSGLRGEAAGGRQAIIWEAS